MKKTLALLLLITVVLAACPPAPNAILGPQPVYVPAMDAGASSR